MLGKEFSTMNQSAGHRTEFWGDVTAGFFGDLRTEVGSEECGNFDASLIAYQMGDLQVFRVIAPEHRVRSRPAKAESPVADCYKLVMQVKGRGVVEQGERSIALNPGEWTIYDPRLSYTIANRSPMEALVLLIPRHPLRTFKLGEVQQPLAGRPEIDSMQALFSDFMHSLSAQLPFLPDSSANAFADATLGLLVSTLAARQAEKDLQRSNPDVMRIRVKQFVNSHLDNADLSIDRIAEEMNCSKRYLHRLFEDEGVTLDRFIWDMRVERCREALALQKESQGGISRIAFAWGFNSNAHFCRAFKSRFGVSPREYQAAFRVA